MAEITKVTFTPFNKEGNNLKGFASVTLDDELVLTGMRLISGNKGLFVSMPSALWQSDEEYHDIYFPITKELREAITEEIVEAYKNQKKKAKEEKEEKKSGKKSSKSKSSKSKKRPEPEDDDDDDDDDEDIDF